MGYGGRVGERVGELSIFCTHLGPVVLSPIVWQSMHVSAKHLKGRIS